MNGARDPVSLRPLNPGNEDDKEITAEEDDDEVGEAFDDDYFNEDNLSNDNADDNVNVEGVSNAFTQHDALNGLTYFQTNRQRRLPADLDISIAWSGVTGRPVPRPPSSTY